MAFPFFDLPPEIRERIYTEVCVDPRPIYVNLSSMEESSHQYFPLSLLLTCHQLYDEVRPIYFLKNKFAITLDRHTGMLSYFFQETYTDNRRSINTLRLTIKRWGTKNYFLETFAPALSDMIMVGNLRHLEVIVKRQHYVPYQAPFTFTGPLTRLLEICDDPYLESVKLFAISMMPIISNGEVEQQEEYTDVGHEFLKRNYAHITAGEFDLLSQTMDGDYRKLLGRRSDC